MINRNLLVLLGALLFIANCESSKPPLEFFPDMYDSPARESQEIDNFNNPTGRRLPPVGVIPVNYYPYPFKDAVTQDDLKNPEKGLANPISSPTLADYKRGEDRYQVFCSPCHGVRGAGNGTVIGPEPRFQQAPPSLLTEKVGGWTDGQIYHVITMGRGLMSSYAYQLEPEDRWKLILYVRKLQAADRKSKTN